MVYDWKNCALVITLFWICCHVQVSCSCTYYPKQRDSDCSYYGTNIPFGELKRLDYPHCLKCTCQSDWLECCGYGFRSGILPSITPPGCIVRSTGCNYKFVYVYDRERECKPLPQPHPHYRYHPSKRFFRNILTS